MTESVFSLSNWLSDLFTGWGLSAGLTNVILAILTVVLICAFVLVVDILLVWVERKVVARFQDRLGPNRLGPFGLIQPIADVIKLLIKEDITPNGASRLVYNLAPILTLAAVLLMWAVIPFAPTLFGTDINVAVLYIVAVGAIGTLSILMAGWASNNKYALLGAFRTVAQMISYEVPMVITLLIPVLLASSMGFNKIIEEQSVWYILVVPLAALIFLITSVAELGRAPFDLIEAESEIVAGFHIEYTGMKFGLFYAGELLHALTFGALFATLFLGGWRGPGVNLPYVGPFLGVIYLFMKAFLLYFVTMWIKYSLPRIRIDHMLSFNWKFLTPLALVLLMVVAILDKVLGNAGVSTLVYVLVMLLANVLIALAALGLVRTYAVRERKVVGDPKPFAQPENTSHVEQPTVTTTT
jgi:NADH-quinone oxidoreductase subunit H